MFHPAEIEVLVELPSKIVGADGPTFTGTAAHGFTPFPGATFTAINADGTVIVGQRTDETWAQRAAVWKNGAAGAFVSLDPKATADAVSDDGRVVIGFQDDLGALGGYRWSSTCGLAWLPSVDGYAVHPTAVSRDGTFVVGLAATRGGRVPVRWSPTQGAERLTVPMAAGDARVSARPFVVLADGTTLGTIDVEYPSGDEPNTTRAAKWTPGNQLVYLQPDAEDLYRASADGSVVTSNQGIWDAAHGWRDVTTVVEQAGGHPSGWELYFADDMAGALILAFRQPGAIGSEVFRFNGAQRFGAEFPGGGLAERAQLVVFPAHELMLHA